ncbi:unnamed protein product [Lactuca virosa]|uniref:Uncharacterized protein n=1 Tax=Lactuca virosa TaxID=75947 RepID=A0AAU9P747_9ASTR|nr:unnamed protein product [Lactuca virosa]
MFNTSATLLQSKKHNPKHPTSIVVVAAALIPFRIVAIDDEKETTMRLDGEQPRHLLQLFVASSPFRTFPYRIPVVKVQLMLIGSSVSFKEDKLSRRIGGDEDEDFQNKIRVDNPPLSSLFT